MNRLNDSNIHHRRIQHKHLIMSMFSSAYSPHTFRSRPILTKTSRQHCFQDLNDGDEMMSTSTIHKSPQHSPKLSPRRQILPTPPPPPLLALDSILPPSDRTVWSSSSTRSVHKRPSHSCLRRSRYTRSCSAINDASRLDDIMLAEQVGGRIKKRSVSFDGEVSVFEFNDRNYSEEGREDVSIFDQLAWSKLFL